MLCSVLRAGPEELHAATAELCKATLAALNGLCRRSLLSNSRANQLAASAADQSAAVGQPRVPAGADARPSAACAFAETVAEQLLKHDAPDGQLANAIAAEACAHAAADLLRDAAEGIKRRNPYHEILAGVLLQPSKQRSPRQDVFTLVMTVHQLAVSAPAVMQHLRGVG